MKNIPYWPKMLGLAGLLPQIICLLYVLDGGEWKFAALAMANAYCVLIFSFLGGIWWGFAAAADAPNKAVPPWLYIAAVMPSLIALSSFIPWIIGEIWPGPSMLLIGGFILISPVVDWAIGRLGLTPSWWFRLRLVLSSGLGGMTIAIGLSA